MSVYRHLGRQLVLLVRRHHIKGIIPYADVPQLELNTDIEIQIQI